VAAQHIVDLSSSPSSARGRIVALIIVCVLLVASVFVSFTATTPGPTLPAFLPAIYSAAILAYALTAFLFANQYVISRSPGFAILSLAYAYAFVLTIPYLVAFPGVFAPAGLIGNGSSSGWLYTFEHFGFIGLVLVYGIIELRAESFGRSAFRAETFVAIATLVTAALAVVFISLSLGSALPPLTRASHFTALQAGTIGPGMVAFIFTTVAILIATLRTGKTIPMWMTVVCIALGLEVFLTNAGGGRFTAGWYFSRVEASLAAGLMLCVFLYYVNIALLLQANNLAQLAAARDAAERSAAENASLLRDYEREQRVASSFQRAALPASLPKVPGVTFDGFYAPGKSEALIGGDWFDALRLPDGRIVLSIGDVAGSGLDAAVIMANMRQVIRGIAHVHTDPAMILEAADRVLRAEHPDRFVTAFVALFDPMYRSLTYATAGHNRPLVRRPDGTIAELGGYGLPLGLRIRGDAHHTTLLVEPGSLFVLYTDGLVESTHDAEAGERRLRAVIEDSAARGNGMLARSIYDGVLVNGSRDDVAILTMYVDTPAAQSLVPEAIGRWKFDSADPTAAGETRARIHEMLERRGVRKAECVAAEVVFSELLGNVVRYAPGTVEVLLDFTNATPVLHVLDEGTGFSRFPELPRNLYSESGRGLYIIATLSEEFTVARRPGRGSHARAVLATNAARRRLHNG
jgi:serine phosphatase RsbU (regulator of sigma subunit)/anti-sigma regulatory factor (Ser/Thr protein kinase)